MYQKFPLPTESMPRSKGFLCLSLKFGCVLTALIYIVYSTLGLAVCMAALGDVDSSPDRVFTLTCVVIDSISHGVSFILSFILLLGLLKDNARHIRPWILWTTFQTLACISVFVVMSAVQMINHITDASFYVYFAEFLILSVRVYMLVLVTSYYKELTELEDSLEATRGVFQPLKGAAWY